MVQTFSNYVKTFNEYSNGWLTIFDIDDTLFRTTALIRVRNSITKETIRTLTTAEYAAYTLGSNEMFDYTEFKDATKFYKESQPIGRMMRRAKLILASAKKYENSRVIILTARTDFDSKNIFLRTFRKYGFDIDSVRVERAGNISDEASGANRKAMIVRKYLNTKSFSKVRFFDDDRENLKAFLRLSREYPTITFEAYRVIENGEIRVFRSI
jgi:hypothetical protein